MNMLQYNDPFYITARVTMGYRIIEGLKVP